jgi:multidrug efflux system membrane fusion protein
MVWVFLAASALSSAIPVVDAFAQTGAVPVTVVPAVRKDVPILLRNIGAVQANQTALIRSRVDGTLMQLFFQEGQEVKQGDRLALIDPAPYKALYDQTVAKKAGDAAQLASAQKDLARYTQLVNRDFASRQQLDQQQATVANLTAQLQADDAQIAAAKVNLDYTNITAPFDGVMGLRQQDVGNVVRLADSTGVGIVTIAQVHPIAVVFSLPQDALPAIRAAMAKGKPPVAAYSANDKAELAMGELATTDNTIDATTGTIKLKAIFHNLDNHLWPGQFVNARLQLGVQKAVVTVPSSTVQRSQNDLYVYVVKPDNTAVVQKVELGQDDGTTAVITKGIDEGALVVLSGQSRLRNGAAVTATQAKPNS